jgi:chromosome segregation ATPase
MTEKLNEQIETTENLLAKLEAEQADVPNKMTIAANDGDSASLISLKRRAFELPIEIEAARIRLAKLRLQLNEEKLPILKEAVQKAAEPIERLMAEYKAAELALNRARGAIAAAEANVKDVNWRIGEQKRELAKMIYDANPKPKANQMPSSLQWTGRN